MGDLIGTKSRKTKSHTLFHWVLLKLLTFLNGIMPASNQKEIQVAMSGVEDLPSIFSVQLQLVYASLLPSLVVHIKKLSSGIEVLLVLLMWM